MDTLAFPLVVVVFVYHQHDSRVIGELGPYYQAWRSDLEYCVELDKPRFAFRDLRGLVGMVLAFI